MRSLARLALGTTAARKRALVALVAVPLALAFVAGVAVGVGAEAGGFALIALIAAPFVGLAAGGLAGRRLFGAAQSVRRTQRAFWIAEKLGPLPLSVRAEEPQRIDILHPAVDPKHFFGGFIAVFNLARRLAERGHRVRVIALEGAPPRDWRRELSGYSGVGRAVERVEFAFRGADEGPIAVNPADALVATHWTAAHVAAEALAALRADRFLYLIQEYEPAIFPNGSAALLARESYDRPHSALFSSGLLRDWFAQERIGVFADGSEGGRSASASFDNAITPVGPVTAAELTRDRRRLIFYARPEEHAARNLFEVGAMALDAAVAAGRFDGWELVGIGTVELRAGWLPLPRSGASVRLVPRQAQSEYARLLSSGDVGLALMNTPHPSLVPIEMAAAGMPTVTSTFANKDQAALAAISANLIAAEPAVGAIVDALARAEERAGDLEARAAGSRVAWPRSWDEALSDDVMAAVEHLLAA